MKGMCNENYQTLQRDIIEELNDREVHYAHTFGNIILSYSLQVVI